VSRSNETLLASGVADGLCGIVPPPKKKKQQVVSEPAQMARVGPTLVSRGASDAAVASVGIASHHPKTSDTQFKFMHHITSIHTSMLPLLGGRTVSKLNIHRGRLRLRTRELMLGYVGLCRSPMYPFVEARGLLTPAPCYRAVCAGD
jgi:hypothetical protein